MDVDDQIYVIWQDSLVEQENGGFNHLFWSPFTAAYAHTYEVTVAHDHGSRTTASIVVPPEGDIVLEEAGMLSDITLPVRVTGGIPNLLKVEVDYGFDYVQTTAGQKIEWLTVPHENRITRVGEDWLIRINLSVDYRAIRDLIRSQRSMDIRYGIELQVIILRLIAASADWSPPDGVFDQEVLVQPGTLSNVTNGFGFIGAGYRMQETWLPPDSVVSAAGFR